MLCAAPCLLGEVEGGGGWRGVHGSGGRGWGVKLGRECGWERCGGVWLGRGSRCIGVVELWCVGGSMEGVDNGWVEGYGWEEEKEGMGLWGVGRQKDKTKEEETSKFALGGSAASHFSHESGSIDAGDAE